MTSVENFWNEISKILPIKVVDSVTALKIYDRLKEAKKIEKQNLIDMSVKSSLYERKWVYEEMSDKKYKPTKVEIRDLKITALEHYNETFKSE
jgi:hypothetical protein